MGSVLGELKRRNVFKVAVAYAIVAWLLAQVAVVFAPALNLPRWSVSLVAFLLILGFPIALLLAWAYELTPEGVKRTASVPLGQSIAHLTGQKLNYGITALLALAVAFLLARDYLFVPAPLAEPAGSVAAPASRAPAGTAEDAVLPNSIAVLPFANMSPDPANAYFAAGMHEELLNQLAKLRNLSVISRTSVLRYTDTTLSIPEIARELNVGTVMEGSVRYANGRVRITTQLIDAKTDNHLWSETYERPFDDVFSVESDIAMNIANALAAEFSPAEQASIEAPPTKSTAAYARYLSALSRGIGGGAPSIALTLDDLDAATDLDPAFALAYAARAYYRALALASSFDAPADYEHVAVADAERAIELDASMGLAHAALGAIAELNWRWADARRESRLAYELSPNNVNVLYQYGRFARNAGDYDEAIRVETRLVQLEPTPLSYNQLAVTYRYARRLAEAAAAARTAMRRAAAGTLSVQLGYAEAGLGHFDAAAEALQTAEQLFAGNYGQVFRVSQMAMAWAQAGRPAEAERLARVLAELDRESPVPPAVWAQAHLALGDYDAAYRELETALAMPSQENYTTLIEIKANPWALPEIDTPRFRELFKDFWVTG